MTPPVSTRIRSLLAQCLRAARDQGYTGTDAAYEYTAEDCDYVIATLSRKPTRQQWADAGLPYVGDAHIQD